MSLSMEIPVWVCVCRCVSVNLILGPLMWAKYHKLPRSHLGCLFIESLLYSRPFQNSLCLNFLEPYSDPLRLVIVLSRSPFCNERKVRPERLSNLLKVALRKWQTGPGPVKYSKPQFFSNWKERRWLGSGGPGVFCLVSPRDWVLGSLWGFLLASQRG